MTSMSNLTVRDDMTTDFIYTRYFYQSIYDHQLDTNLPNCNQRITILIRIENCFAWRPCRKNLLKTVAT